MIPASLTTAVREKIGASTPPEKATEPLSAAPREIEKSAMALKLESLGKEILVVDDESIIRRMIDGGLTAKGYKVQQAVTGQEALDLLEKHPDRYALVITDNNMPVMEGKELIRKIRASPQLQNIPIIFMSGLDISDVAKTVGATVAIQKPFRAADILTLMEKQLEIALGIQSILGQMIYKLVGGRIVLASFIEGLWEEGVFRSALPMLIMHYLPLSGFLGVSVALIAQAILFGIAHYPAKQRELQKLSLNLSFRQFLSTYFLNHFGFALAMGLSSLLPFGEWYYQLIVPVILHTINNSLYRFYIENGQKPPSWLRLQSIVPIDGVSSISIPSRRHGDVNEDAHFFSRLRNGLVTAAVSDGLGRRAKGALASRTARDTLRNRMVELETREVTEIEEDEIVDHMIDSMIAAQTEIIASADKGSQTGTAAALLVMRPQTEGDRVDVFVANAADTRVYRKEPGGSLEPLTIDNLRPHEVENPLVDNKEGMDELRDETIAGRLQNFFSSMETTQDLQRLGADVEDFKKRNVTGNSLREGKEHWPVITVTDARVGSLLILSSDGLHDNLSDREIDKIANQHTEPAALANALVQAARKRADDKDHLRSSDDDITVVVIKVGLSGEQKAGIDEGTDSDLPAAILKTPVRTILFFKNALIVFWSVIIPTLIGQAIYNALASTKKFSLRRTAVFLSSLFDGLWEEGLFRGALLSLLINLFPESPILAVMGQAVLFSVLHFFSERKKLGGDLTFGEFFLGQEFINLQYDSSGESTRTHVSGSFLNHFLFGSAMGLVSLVPMGTWYYPLIVQVILHVINNFIYRTYLSKGKELPSWLGWVRLQRMAPLKEPAVTVADYLNRSRLLIESSRTRDAETPEEAAAEVLPEILSITDEIDRISALHRDGETIRLNQIQSLYQALKFALILRTFGSRKPKSAPRIKSQDPDLETSLRTVRFGTEDEITSLFESLSRLENQFKRDQRTGQTDEGLLAEFNALSQEVLLTGGQAEYAGSEITYSDTVAYLRWLLSRLLSDNTKLRVSEKFAEDLWRAGSEHAENLSRNVIPAETVEGLKGPQAVLIDAQSQFPYTWSAYSRRINALERTQLPYYIGILNASEDDLAGIRSRLVKNGVNSRALSRGNFGSVLMDYRKTKGKIDPEAIYHEFHRLLRGLRKARGKVEASLEILSDQAKRYRRTWRGNLRISLLIVLSKTSFMKVLPVEVSLKERQVFVVQQ